MRRFILALVFALAASFALAQDDLGNPNDPAENERANACFAGGSWEGKCHTTDTDFDGDVDIHDINWMWRCGWYVIRVERGLLNEGQYPSECYTKVRLFALGAVGPSCPPLQTFNVPDVGTPPNPTVVPSLGPVINNIIAFAQSRGLGWNPSTGATGLIALANAYYASPVTLISPDPRTSSFAPRDQGITYTITADIGFDGCYDITVIVTSDTINFVETNAFSFFPSLP